MERDERVTAAAAAPFMCGLLLVVINEYQIKDKIREIKKCYLNMMKRYQTAKRKAKAKSRQAAT